MYKIGIIGDEDSILGFKSLGLSVFPARDPSEAEKLVHELAKKEYAVIYITEQIANVIPDVIESYRVSLLPAIIPIPGNQGVIGIGMQSVKRSVERAVGADILFKDE
jgi:V/A-type H+-transporting ATPase subunit F